ncbi:MAG TPA: nuclear transport factor 2 family protein [Planctomycetota bacterium]|nr:nuclear transport factor 2 family protein [Planctomycetota bacterium]
MSNVEVVQKMYEAFGRSDRVTILDLLDPNVEWVQNDGFPGGGRHFGAEAVLNNVFAKLKREWDVWQAPVSEWLDAGEIVVAVGEYRGTYKATGRSMKAAFAGLYRVRNGRIVQFRQFTDTARIVEAVV